MAPLPPPHRPPPTLRTICGKSLYLFIRLIFLFVFFYFCLILLRSALAPYTPSSLEISFNLNSKIAGLPFAEKSQTWSNAEFRKMRMLRGSEGSEGGGFSATWQGKTATWRKKAGTCECYKRKSPLFRDESLGGPCVCHVACMYGSHVAVMGERCANPRKGSPDNLFSGVRCSKKLEFEKAIRSAKSELVKHVVTKKSISWLESRKSIKWLNGTTVLTILDPSAQNIYHIASKTMPWKWMDMVTDPVDRVFIKRHPDFLESLQQKGNESEHAGLMASLLNNLLKNMSCSSNFEKISPERMLSTPLYPILNGKVFFESDRDFLEASEEEPLCFESVVISGNAKGSLYQQAKTDGTDYTAIVSESLQIVETKRRESYFRKPNLLYVRRRPGNFKRGLSLKSEKKMVQLLRKLELPTRMIDLGTIPFKKQIENVRWADIIIGVHGANMLNPSLFMEERSILIELFPWHFIWGGYGNSTMALGGIYMGYMLNRQSQPLSHLSVSKCQDSGICISTYRDIRGIEISDRDIPYLSELLEKSKVLSQDIIKSRLKTKWKLKGDVINQHFENCLKYYPENKNIWMGYLNYNSWKIEHCVINSTEIEAPIPILRDSKEVVKPLQVAFGK